VRFAPALPAVPLRSDKGKSEHMTSTKSVPSGADAPAKHLRGKVAVVTGGSSGIGLGIASVLLDAGMKVVITYRSEKHLDHAMSVLAPSADRQVHAIELEVADRTAVREAALKVDSLFGKTHVLICNAGVGPFVSLSNATFDDWDWCVGVNVTGVFNCIKAFLPRIQAHGEGGHIVATASMLGGMIAGPFWGVYSTTKFAVVGMMEALRSELLDTDVGVSVFCPAGVGTNIKTSDRNRPAALTQAGAPDAIIEKIIREFSGDMQRAIQRHPDQQLYISAEDAGRCVLRGIVENQLYIISHPEYEQALRDRAEAIQRSMQPAAGISDLRRSLAEISRNPIYSGTTRQRGT
jgi:NAD(P)-dependent dehydrogenase (short-subunit alcohol dehydrogenase family)